MAPLRSIAPLLLATIVVSDNTIGFSHAFVNNCVRPVSRTKIFSTKEVVAKEEITSEDKTSITTLNLSGEAVFTSDLAALDKNKSLHDFFALPHAATLLLRGSKNNEVDEVENVDSELFMRYQQNCKKHDTSSPTPNDRIYDVTTAGLQFPGLKVMSVVTIGIKMISTSSDLPGYEFVIIRDATYAKGSRLFVWFFNQATGKNKVSKDDEPSPGKEQTTFSVTRINVVPKENDMICFRSNANLSLLVQLPSFIMKAIPGANKENFEKTGGESILKALEDDLPMSLEGFRQEYIRWLEE